MAAHFAPKPVERECDVFSRRVAVHLARREYAEASRVLEMAVERVESAWIGLSKPPTYVTDLDLPEEICRALERNGITTVDRLLTYSRAEFLAFQIVGVRRVDIIEATLKRWGLRLRGDRSKRVSPIP